MKLAIASEDKNIYIFDEQGNYKKKFSTKSGSENYEIIQILFEQQSENLAVARSDNLLLVYKLGINWEEKELRIYELNLESKPNCMILPKKEKNGIIFGLENGAVGFFNEGEKYDLFFCLSPCVSISSSFDGNYIISGHKDYSIIKYNIQEHTSKQLFNHSCLPTCLAFIKNSYIIVAGNNKKVTIYNEKGEIFKNFDVSDNNDAKEFECMSINTSGDAIALGNYNSIYVFLFNESINSWEYFFKTIENYSPITSICWKPDGTAYLLEI